MERVKRQPILKFSHSQIPKFSYSHISKIPHRLPFSNQNNNTHNTMKKVYASLCAALLGVGSMQAERGPLILNSLAEYHVSNLSPNGQWACGWFENYSLQAYAFRWNLQTNNVEILSNDEVQSCAFDVSNNGVVCGWFYDATATANGAKAKSAGYWDGTWHSLPNVNNEAASSVDGVTRARAISPDGHYVGGLAQNWGAAVVWKDGKIFQQQSVANTLVGSSNDVYAVSSDGTMMAGWATPSTSTYDGERVPILWRQGKDPVWLADDSYAGYSYARAFSSNDRWLLYWGGYVEDTTLPYGVGLNAIYDTQTDTKITVPCMADDGADLELSDINANGTAVGRGTFTYKFDGEETDSVVSTLVMYKDGKTLDLVAYLKEQGVDISALPGFVEVTSCAGISDDEKTFAVYYTDENYGTRSSIIKLDQQLSDLPPVQLSARTLPGTKSVRLTWEEPLAGASAVKSYEVYRGTEKVGTCQPSDRFFFDGPLATGAYSYTVKAVYDDTTSESSEAVSATVEDQQLQAPTHLTARQARLSGARLQWEQPQSNLTVKNYYSTTDEISGFGGGTNDFECALRFPATEMALYTAQHLTAVSFYPMSEQKTWTINVYTKTPGGDDLTLLASQPVSQTLSYGKKNTVKLDSPLTLPTGKDIYVAVKVSVDPESTSASTNVVGQVYGLCEAGFSDMVRQTTEADFYSLYETAQQSGSLFAVTWAMDAIFTPDGTAQNIDDVDHYDVTVDGKSVATTSELSCEVGAMDEGTHSLGVAAVYASGESSAPTTVSLDVVPNEDFYKAITSVSISKAGDNAVRADWTVPTDADNTVISYAKGNMKQGVTGNESENYSYMAAADYTPSLLHAYEGYQITALRYMPLCDAVYTLTLQCDGKDVAVAEPDDYSLNSWNSVKLSTPVTIEAGKTYRLVVDCYDVETGKAALPIDDMPEFSGVSNLLSTDSGSNFSSLYSNASLHGNWMIGLDVASTDVRELPVLGYDVVIDRKKVNDEHLTTNTYTHTLAEGDTNNHTLRVDAVYDVKGSVRGTAVYFSLATAGINDATVASLTVDRKGSVLSVTGANVKSLTLVNAAGATVKSAEASEIDVTALPAGAYVLSVKLASGEQRAQKLLIK